MIAETVVVAQQGMNVRSGDRYYTERCCPRRRGGDLNILHIKRVLMGNCIVTKMSLYSIIVSL